MKDNLEKFISGNREEFDIYETPAGSWEKIEKNIRPKRQINWKVVLGRAAAVVVIFIASYMVHEYFDNNGEVITEKIEKAAESEIPELKEAEIYYSTLIKEKIQEIKPMLTENPALEKEIKYDLDQLDSVYFALKKDLRDNIANEEIIEAMIQNYRLRLSILEDVLSMIKPNDNEKEIEKDTYNL